MEKSRYQIVFITASGAQEAERIATALVEERLAACVNIVPNCRSVYRWKGELVNEQETLMLVKTKRESFDKLADRVEELHSYDVPEVIAVDLESISQGYRRFLVEALGE